MAPLSQRNVTPCLFFVWEFLFLSLYMWSWEFRAEKKVGNRWGGKVSLFGGFWKRRKSIPPPFLRSLIPTAWIAYGYKLMKVETSAMGRRREREEEKRTEEKWREEERREAWRSGQGGSDEARTLCLHLTGLHYCRSMLSRLCRKSCLDTWHLGRIFTYFFSINLMR